MTTGADSHILISVFNAQYDFTTKSGGVRGFIPDAALPPEAWQPARRTDAGQRISLSGMTTSAVADLFDAKCDTDALFPGTAGSAPTTSETNQLGGLNQSYRPDARYQGDSTPKFFDGNYLANYNGFPSPIGALSDPRTAKTYAAFVSFDPSRVKQVPIMVNTTGVGGGGIVRAIIPVGSAYKQYDHFAYEDPNEFCATDSTLPTRRYRDPPVAEAHGLEVHQGDRHANRGLGAEEPHLEHFEF